jgi:hypothetical protein
MTDPITIAAKAIAQIAFDEFVKVSPREATQANVSGTFDPVNGLRNKIRAKFQGNQRAEMAWALAEHDGSQTARAMLEIYLDDAMGADPDFAHEIRQAVQQIVTPENQIIEGNRTDNQTTG